MADKQSTWQENENYLKGMSNMAQGCLKFLRKYKNRWKEDWYVRIAKDSYRAVSLNNDTPLMGYAKYGTKCEETLLKHFIEGKPNNSFKEVPERRVQCWLIKQALKNSLDMKQVLLLDGKPYEKLLFALDELSLWGERKDEIPYGDPYEKLRFAMYAPLLEESGNKQRIRCDILAVGIRNGKAFPVLIELKSDHNLKKLIEQLDGFCTVIEYHPEAFKELLRNCFDEQVGVSRINTNHIEKIIIWNKKGTLKKDTIRTLRGNKIRLLQYEWKSDSVKEVKGIEEIKLSRYHAIGL